MITFSEAYPSLRDACDCAREERAVLSEHAIQCAWYEQRLRADELVSCEGHRLRVVSPGWWNQAAGPDFKGAQIAFNGHVISGDVEIHLRSGEWNEHGHQRDSRYDNVILHVVFDDPSPVTVTTFSGRKLPTLILRPYVHEDLQGLLEYSETAPTIPLHGRCARLIPEYGTQPLEQFLRIAGEWRMLSKARGLRERMEQAGPAQAVYESFMAACGFSHFKHHFEALARALPHDRAGQLARQDPLLLEAALLQLAGLLPAALPEGTTAVPHFARLRALVNQHLPGLRKLPLEWKRVGVRPNNYPERRIAGAALYLARAAQSGLLEEVMRIWRLECSPLQRRLAFEKTFPRSLGFWATHCTWTGKKLSRPTAPLGTGRSRSIIGNVFVATGLAMARREGDLMLEDRVLEFFAALPAESGNQVTRRMAYRLLNEGSDVKLNFRMQQGLLQMHQDWCEPNPSCRNCGLLRYLEEQGRMLKAAGGR